MELSNNVVWELSISSIFGGGGGKGRSVSLLKDVFSPFSSESSGKRYDGGGGGGGGEGCLWIDSADIEIYDDGCLYERICCCCRTADNVGRDDESRLCNLYCLIFSATLTKDSDFLGGGLGGSEDFKHFALLHDETSSICLYNEVMHDTEGGMDLGDSGESRSEGREQDGEGAGKGESERRDEGERWWCLRWEEEEE